MRDVIAHRAPNLAFMAGTSVREVAHGGLFEVERQGRLSLLTPFEALLCSVLERGGDPAQVIGADKAASENLHNRLERLGTALRAYLVSEGGTASDTVFDVPAFYLAACRQKNMSAQLMLRDIAPQEVVWYVTHRCPRRCRYCHWVDKGRSDLEPDILAQDRAEGLMREAWFGGAERLVMTGGEPMLRRDLMEIIGSGSALGLPVWLFTRYHFTPERALQLADTQVDRVFYSLDALNAGTNIELVENGGVGDEAKRSLRALTDAGLEVTVVPVLTALNATGLRELAQELVDIKVKSIRPIAYKGRVGSEYNALFQLSDDDKARVLDSLDDVKEIMLLDRTTLDLEKKAGICESGISTIYVQPNGDVSYCPLTQGNEGAPFGQLPRDRLGDLWNNQRLAAVLAGNAMPLANKRHLVRTSSVSSCVLRKERMDLI